jgi:hypothetical protein
MTDEQFVRLLDIFKSSPQKTIIGTLTGVLLGGLISVAIPFIQRRLERGKIRQRLKSELIQNITVIYKYSQLTFSYRNSTALNSRFCSHLWKMFHEAPFGKPEREALERSYHVFAEAADDCRSTTRVYNDKIIIAEGLLNSQLIEVKNHFGESCYKKLRPSIGALRLLINSNYESRNYKQLNYQECIDLNMNNVLESEAGEYWGTLQEKSETLITEIDTILNF